MNIKRALIALAVEILATNTSLVHKAEPRDAFWNSFFGIETDEQRMTRNIETEVDRASATLKSININRKFKKIVRNV